MHHNDPSIRELLGSVIDGTTTLVRQELRLAQAEAAQKMHHAKVQLISLMIGLLLAFCALLILLQALVVSLALVVPAWLASVIVGLVLVGLAVAFISYGQKDLTHDLKPTRTLRSVRKDKEMVMEKVR
ncbi:MAG: phage holin family protein [Rhodospirillaceae bacterium]